MARKSSAGGKTGGRGKVHGKGATPPRKRSLISRLKFWK
jgi:hypothetical protein